MGTKREVASHRCGSGDLGLAGAEQNQVSLASPEPLPQVRMLHPALQSTKTTLQAAPIPAYGQSYALWSTSVHFCDGLHVLLGG